VLNQNIISYKEFIKEKNEQLNELEIKSVKYNSDISEFSRLYNIENDKLNKVKNKIEVIQDQMTNKSSLAKGTKIIVENQHL
ncbi:chromosome segregation ATPase Smc domain protein, partial [Chlamydia psittaci 01DC11]